jgi:hypothetical protein
MGSAVVSTAVFGVPPRTFPPWQDSPNGERNSCVGLAGGTPARATETVALPNFNCMDTAKAAVHWESCCVFSGFTINAIIAAV